MAKSRYIDSKIIDGKYFSTFKLPRIAGGYRNIDLLAGVQTRDHVFSAGERLDHLAAKFFEDDQYWWVIALVNKINYPFASGGLVPGVVLKIPLNVQDILNKVLR